MGAALALCAAAPAQTNLATQITYQGRLEQGGTPVNGNTDLRFSLFDVATGGTALATHTSVSVPVAEGLFTATPDFGAVFDGRALWVEIAVRNPPGSGSYITLLPRQAITAAPYALGVRLPLAETVAVPDDNAVRVANTAPGGRGLFGLSSGSGGRGIYGSSTGTAGIGVLGDSGAQGGIAVQGLHAFSGNYGQLGTNDVGAAGVAVVPSSTGVVGTHVPSGNVGRLATATEGVRGFTTSSTSNAVVGLHGADPYLTNHPPDYGAAGVYGFIASGVGAGVVGERTLHWGGRSHGYLGAPEGGVVGIGEMAVGYYGSRGRLGTSGIGVIGELINYDFDDGIGVLGRGRLDLGTGVRGENAMVGVSGEGSSIGVEAESTYLYGDALVATCSNEPGSTGNIAVFNTRLNGSKSRKARIDASGRGYFNGGTQTGGADVAEAMLCEGEHAEYGPGDVLVISTIGDRTVAKSDEAYSTLAAGVHATKPGVLLTDRHIDDALSGTVPVAVVGIVPTRVSAENGPIRRGDLLVTAGTRGHAMKGTDRSRMLGAIIGKALQDFAPESPSGVGVIEVMVNVK